MGHQSLTHVFEPEIYRNTKADPSAKEPTVYPQIGPPAVRVNVVTVSTDVVIEKVWPDKMNKRKAKSPS